MPIVPIVGRLRFFVRLGGMLLMSAPAVPASVIWVEARDYRREEQSPWYPGILNGSVYFENFISGPIGTQGFGTPYISSPAGRKGDSSGYYSVDGDDGIIDSFGRFGGSYTAGNTRAPDGVPVSFRFDFSRNEGGDLPHAVGLVITNAHLNTFRPSGNRSVATAFDSNGGLRWTPKFGPGAKL